MPTKYNIYPNLGYWFLTLIALVFAGFYTTYFSVLFQPKPAFIHFHFMLMALWIIMLIAQPFLIKYKKLTLHRTVGKASYVLVPLVLFSAFLMIRQEYYGYIVDLGQEVAPALTHTEILKQAANEPIALIYFTWFTLFYLLAIINRRRSNIHSRYMLATALTLLGPTVDRILGIHFGVETLLGFIPSYLVSFLIIDMVLALLLYSDYKNKKSVRALTTCLLIYLAGQVLYFLTPYFDWWPTFMAFIMKPAP